MSSSEFSKVLVRDERLDCHPSIPFAVYKSGQNVTVATFDAISQSAASHTYNIQVPSETTIIDRRVMWQSTVTGTIQFSMPAGLTAAFPGGRYTAGSAVLKYAENFGFSPFPLHTLCSTQQITINNNTVSINMNDVLPAIMKLNIDRELQHYNQTALTETDYYFDQGDTKSFANWPMAGVNQLAQDRCYEPRGLVTGLVLSNCLFNGVATVAPGGAVTSAFQYGATAGGLTVGVNAGTWQCDVTATFIEPLICPPFIYNNPYYNGQGFYGIQNLNYVFNINTNANSGMFRLAFAASEQVGTVQIAATSNWQVTNFVGSRLIFNFLSPKPSDMLTARNVVPYWEMPRFTVLATGPPAGIQSTVQGTIAPGTAQINSQSIQLNQIPDKLIIFVRRAKSARTVRETDYSFGIRNISINFNNQSGILASATQDQLWRFSVESGSIQTFDEFRGVGNVGTGSASINSNNLPLLGSYLMLEMGRHIQITEDYYASGSLGNFNLQFRIEVENYSPVNFSGANAVELVLITQNSGIFVSEKGQSAVYTGVLTKDDVLSASASEAVNERALSRMVGGMNFGKLVSGVAKAAPIADLIGKTYLPENSKIRQGIEGVSGVAKAFKGDGRSGGARVRGAGKGSARFSLDDRLV